MNSNDDIKYVIEREQQRVREFGLIPITGKYQHTVQLNRYATLYIPDNEVHVITGVLVDGISQAQALGIKIQFITPADSKKLSLVEVDDFRGFVFDDYLKILDLNTLADANNSLAFGLVINTICVWARKK